MKTSVIAASALALLLIVGATAVALASDGQAPMAQVRNSDSDHGFHGHNGNDNGQGHDDQRELTNACQSLASGESLTLSGLTGHFFDISGIVARPVPSPNAFTRSSTSTSVSESTSISTTKTTTTISTGVRGNASGTFDLQVGQTYLGGCTLSIVGGSFKLGTTSYALTGGSLVLSHEGRSGDGSGTASTGTFLISITGLHGDSTSASAGQIRLDFKVGSSEFLVILGSPKSSD